MIRFHCGHFMAPDWASSLRGEYVWRQMQSGLRLGYRLRRILRGNFSKGTPPEVHVNEYRITNYPTCTHTVLFVCMPNLPEVPEVLYNYRTHGATVIVDYVGDVLNLTPLEAMSPRAVAAAGTNKPEAYDYWRQPEVSEALQESLLNASVITTPFPEFIPGLSLMTGNKIPVCYLPDLMEKKLVQALRFRRRLFEVIEVAQNDV